MKQAIGVGVIGGGYMGKAHSVALQSVGAIFNTRLRPVCEMICTTSSEGAKQKALELGFKRSTADWRQLINDPAVEAVVIACPQKYHREIALAAFAQGKAVFCEKPLGETLDDARDMVKAAEESGLPNMTGYNYIRTPASQLAYEMITSGEIGEVTYFRGEHTEDFFTRPEEAAGWRAYGRANGAIGDLAPHIINGALRLVGPIHKLIADIQTVHQFRLSSDTDKVANDDHGHFICQLESGALGNISFSRIASGRKMGYIYEIFGTKGAIRFDQEDQNALWFYQSEDRFARQGFRKILTGPEHPDYKPFCLGPGHGTGYQDQIIIEQRDFLKAIETGQSVWPTFRDGLQVKEVVEAAWLSCESREWVEVRSR